CRGKGCSFIRPPPLFAGPFLSKPVHSRSRRKGRTARWYYYSMKHDHDRVREAQRMVALVSACPTSLEQAIKTALSSVGGTAFEAKLREVDHQVVWKVKLVVGGERVKVVIDARSGYVITAKAETIVTEPVSPNHVPSRAFESHIEL